MQVNKKVLIITIILVFFSSNLISYDYDFENVEFICSASIYSDTLKVEYKVINREAFNIYIPISYWYFWGSPKDSSLFLYPEQMFFVNTIIYAPDYVQGYYAETKAFFYDIDFPKLIVNETR